MSDIHSRVQEHQALSPPRSAHGGLPSGFRIVHVAVPESVFNHAKAQAYLSGIRFAVYVAKVLSDSRPYPANRLPQAPAVPPDPRTVEADHGQP